MERTVSGGTDLKAMALENTLGGRYDCRAPARPGADRFGGEAHSIEGFERTEEYLLAVVPRTRSTTARRAAVRRRRPVINHILR